MRGAKLVGTVRDGRTARRTATRRAIITAATALFAKKGVTSTSIDDIAELAGTAKGSVFYNFGSKSGLVSEMFDSYAENLAAAIGRHTHGLSGDDLTAGVVRAVLIELNEHTDAARVIVSELFRTGSDWAEPVARWREVATAPIVAARVAQRGESARDHAQVEASAIVGATLSAGLEWLAYRPASSREEIEAVVLGLLQLPTPPQAASESVPPAV